MKNNGNISKLFNPISFYCFDITSYKHQKRPKYSPHKRIRLYTILFEFNDNFIQINSHILIAKFIKSKKINKIYAFNQDVQNQIMFVYNKTTKI